jgi:eukaryotic-like serine/threonine-protein kinase
MEDALSAGSLLARRYRLIDQIGAGGMSVIWRARDEVLDRIVALKVLAPELAADRRYRDLVREEARNAAQLVHAHVTAVHDYGEVIAPDGAVTAFVVMELLAGESLERRLTAGPLPWPEALDVCAQVAEALAAAHRIGVVHRDIAPGNIMLTEAGVKVLDFGIATRVGAPDEDEDGDTFGTPAYVAPERLDGTPSLPSTDTYALGVMLYETLTGRVPFPALTWDDLARTPRHGTPPAPSGVPGLPHIVAELCRSCLSRSPLDRPTAHQVAELLRANLPQAGALVPAPDPKPQVPAPALPELPPAVVGGPARPEPVSPESRRTLASDAAASASDTTAPPRARTIAAPARHLASTEAPARRPARRWIRVVTVAAAAVVALVTFSTVVPNLRQSGDNPRSDTLAPSTQAPASPTPSRGPDAAAPPARTSPSAGASPSRSSLAGRAPTVGETISAISQIIDAGVAAREIRPDAAVDLRNVVRNLQESIARGTANLAAEAASLQDKVAARKREGAITGASADQLETELVRLGRL